MVGDHRR